MHNDSAKFSIIITLLLLIVLNYPSEANQGEVLIESLPGNGRLTIEEDLIWRLGEGGLIIRDGNRLIVAIGDSIVAGHPRHNGSPDFYPGIEARPDYASSSIWFWLRMWLPEYFIMNQGVGSTSSTYWISDGTGGLYPQADHGSIKGPLSEESMVYKRALRFKPRYLMIGVGANDLSQGIKIEDTVDAVSRICDAAASKGAIPVVLSVPYQKADSKYQNEKKRQETQALNQAYKDMIANKEYEAYFVDYTTPLADGAGNTEDEFLQDYIHPNVEGYRIAASTIHSIVPFKDPPNLKYILFTWDGGDGFAMPKNLRLVFGAPDHISPERGYEPDSVNGYSKELAGAVASGNMSLGKELHIFIPNKPYISRGFLVPAYLVNDSYEVLISIIDAHNLEEGKFTGFSKIEYIYIDGSQETLTQPDSLQYILL
jgi:lysophospholipase L1-like esterase